MAASSKKAADPYDIIVAGAGPAGCEAALASGLSGARTLCLTINLDTTGFPPGSPVLVDGVHDKRSQLLEILHNSGIFLSQLLLHDNVHARSMDPPTQKGQILIDRRELGLAYKEMLESSANVEPRQALITSIEPDSGGYMVTTRLGERFRAACVVIAAGSFLKGEVTDSVGTVPGGRRCEIPSNALALSLQSMGIQFCEVHAASASRFDARSIAAISAGSGPRRANLPADGSQLNEIYGAGVDSTADEPVVYCEAAAASVGEPWVTRNQYYVRHLTLSAGQVNPSLESPNHPGLFFAGRVAGCSSYVEAAATGLIAGQNACQRATGKEPDELPAGHAIASQLCEAIATKKSRPVSVNDGNISVTS